MKKCYRCHVLKDISDFHKHKSRKDGFSDIYKMCANIDSKKRRAIRISKEKIEVFEKICFTCKLLKTSDKFWKSIDTQDGLRSSCTECERVFASVPTRQSKKYKSRKLWNANNADRVKDTVSKYRKIKRQEDPNFRLRLNVSNVIRETIRNRQLFNCKLDRLNQYIFDRLPYTSEELKLHIESLWEPWMTWNNYGKFDKTRDTWQIDHIIPQSALPFDSFDDENFYKLWALKNLRPLETMANLRKGNKLIPLAA
jgi:5-methylcytosine-specific restriction endonuclease McrA